MSIHGLCFDEGQSGRCGWECRALLNGECSIPEELINEEITGDQLEILYEIYGLTDTNDWYKEEK